MDGTWMQLFGQIDKLHRSFWLKARSRKKNFGFNDGGRTCQLVVREKLTSISREYASDIGRSSSMISELTGGVRMYILATLQLDPTVSHPERFVRNDFDLLFRYCVAAELGEVPANQRTAGLICTAKNPIHFRPSFLEFLRCTQNI
jgi:hypothetical protein|tara:strand:+ start:6666 stop:7103 length:438 start_codon:yes stop_codon:yes gene_type:complete